MTPRTRSPAGSTSLLTTTIGPLSISPLRILEQRIHLEALEMGIKVLEDYSLVGGWEDTIEEVKTWNWLYVNVL